MTARFQTQYQQEVVPALTREFGYTNPMQVPKIQKVTINIGLGEALQNPKALDAAIGDLAAITGQKPVVTRAKKSIAAYKVRQGNPIGVMVTLRGEKAWEFWTG